jgi:DNA-binding beta-propeller fold protein YncE
MGDCNCKHGASGAGGVCVECDIPQLARNNYFTGKLLVERDFTDEQRYLLGKLRRHNQRLHGWGVVCGMKVKQHPNPACQDRFVIIEPGTAIDCCGREILATREEYFDFKAQFLLNWQKQHGPNLQPDPKEPHKIQICVSYKECGTEDIPALFDDCSCDATSCQPNRILDSYGFDVLIAPKSTGADGQNIDVDWSCTIGLANVVRAAVNDATKRLYALTSVGTGPTSTATLYAVDTTNDSILASQTFPKSTGLDVAVSPAGDFVYVALQPAAAKPQILVLASDLTTTVNTLGPFGTNGDAVRLGVAPAPDGRLLAVIPSKNNVLIWKTDINGPNPPSPAPATPVTVGTTPVSIAISDNGLYAYVANSGSNNVSAITLATLTPTTPLPGLPGTAVPSAVAAASTTAGDTLAVLDSTNKSLYFIGIPAAGPGSAVAIGSPVTTFAYPPIDVRVSPAGHWAYVLEQDSAAPNTGYVQLVDVHAVQLNGPNILGNPVSVGIQPTSETLSEDGKHLYVTYSGDGKSVPGAVAVLNVVQDACCDLLNRTIEGCPDCTDGNCIILATINNYKFGQLVVDSEIDNLTDRHLLVSTDVLTQVVQCLCEQGGGTGTAGPQGPPGASGTNGLPGQDGQPGIQGPAGPGIDLVNATFVPCDVPGSASITGTSPTRTLNLVIPGECNRDLTGVSNVSWAPATGVLGAVSLAQLFTKPGLKIAFTASVQAADLTNDTIVLLAPVIVQSDLISWCEVPIQLVPGNFSPVGNVAGTFTPGAVAGLANGVAFFASQRDTQALLQAIKTQKPLHLLIKGDFIRDSSPKQRGLDGNHLPPWVPKRPSGDGIEGGTFESWFTLKD